jgi:adenine-specific DNA glycosylase
LADLKAFERHYAEQLIEEILETSRPITKTQALAGLLGVSICTNVSPKQHDCIDPLVSQHPFPRPANRYVH